MSDKIDVLDHGFVRLVDSMGNDLSIVRNARVSHDAEWRTGKDSGKDERLLRFLYEHKHNTPFEAVTMTFEVKAPIFVFRQWHRHRTWSYNEISARYAELPEEFYIPEPQYMGSQSTSNHQSRDLDTGLEDSMYMDRTMDNLNRMTSHNKNAFRLYKELIKQKVPRELARSVLPVATYSRMFATVNLNNLFRFLGERLEEGAQYEIRVYAEAMLEIASKIAPIAVNCFREEFKS